MKNTEKRSKFQTLYLGATAGIAILILGVATYAWYANNKNVDANVMQFESNTTPNIVINTDPEEIAKIGDVTQTPKRTVNEDDFEVDFQATPVILLPSTHDDSQTTKSAVSFDTGLMTIADLENASTANGNVIVKDDDTFIAVSTGGIDTYYQDYRIYIASADLKMENCSIVASFSVGTTPSSVTAGSLEQNTYLKAASVDLYSATIASTTDANIILGKDTFKGTLNLADTSKTVTVFSNGTIPATYDKDAATQGNGYICVVMRFYFDGALQDSSGNCYVRSSNLCTTGLGVSVHFKAQEAGK